MQVRHRPTGGGSNPYYPALLSDTVMFLGAGLCWGFRKASTALRLPYQLSPLCSRPIDGETTTGPMFSFSHGTDCRPGGIQRDRGTDITGRNTFTTNSGIIRPVASAAVTAQNVPVTHGENSVGSESVVSTGVSREVIASSSVLLQRRQYNGSLEGAGGGGSMDDAVRAGRKQGGDGNYVSPEEAFPSLSLFGLLNPSSLVVMQLLRVGTKDVEESGAAEKVGS